MRLNEFLSVSEQFWKIIRLFFWFSDIIDFIPTSTRSSSSYQNRKPLIKGKACKTLINFDDYKFNERSTNIYGCKVTLEIRNTHRCRIFVSILLYSARAPESSMLEYGED